MGAASYSIFLLVRLLASHHMIYLFCFTFYFFAFRRFFKSAGTICHCEILSKYPNKTTWAPSKTKYLCRVMDGSECSFITTLANGVHTAFYGLKDDLLRSAEFGRNYLRKNTASTIKTHHNEAIGA